MKSLRSGQSKKAPKKELNIGINFNFPSTASICHIWKSIGGNNSIFQLKIEQISIFTGAFF